MNNISFNKISECYLVYRKCHKAAKLLPAKLLLRGLIKKTTGKMGTLDVIQDKSLVGWLWCYDRCTALLLLNTV